MSKRTKTLAELGELGFINIIRRMMPGDGDIFLRSVGDDCLITESSGEDLMLATTDTFVDGVHFTMEYFTLEYIGLRCMAASISDIAAMSGIPVYSLVSLSMPQNTLVDDAVSLFAGLQKNAGRYGCPVAGGETTSTPGPLTVTVTVIGRVEKGRAITRAGAQVGDSIYVTGTIGDAMAGLMAFEHSDKDFSTLKKKFVAPEARTCLSRLLTASYHITSMIDLSDGLTTDLWHICNESLCGAEIHASTLPFSDEYRSFSEKYSLDTIDFAISAGEDFELLFTSGDIAIPKYFTLNNCAVTRIGTIIDQSHGMKLIRDNNISEQLVPKGYEHFKL